MRRAVFMALLVNGMTLTAGAANLERGQQVFGQACIACHSLEPEKNMTGPSLSALWGRKAGTLPSFTRYSPALKSADVVWGDETLDEWLADPQAFIPGNHMVFPGIGDADTRTDLIGFLKDATQLNAATAQGMPNMGGMMGMGADVPNLKEAPASSQVKAITFCGDT